MFKEKLKIIFIKQNTLCISNYNKKKRIILSIKNILIMKNLL
jgi:hypothetical protein